VDGKGVPAPQQPSYPLAAVLSLSTTLSFLSSRAKPRDLRFALSATNPRWKRHPLLVIPSEAERLSELSSDRLCSPSRVKLNLLHLSSPWTGAPCLHRRSRGTTWVEQDGAAPLPLFSFACSEAKETKSSLARRAERCAADLSRLPRLAVGRAVEGSAVLRTFRGNVF
jgi:hypothetical protein